MAYVIVIKYLSNFDCSLFRMDVPKKFDKRNFLRMTSVSCVNEPQTSALSYLKNNDLRAFADLINTPDVEVSLDPFKC